MVSRSLTVTVTSFHASECTVVLTGRVLAPSSRSALAASLVADGPGPDAEDDELGAAAIGMLDDDG